MNWIGRCWLLSLFLHWLFLCYFYLFWIIPLKIDRSEVEAWRPHAVSKLYDLFETIKYFESRNRAERERESETKNGCKLFWKSVDMKNVDGNRFNRLTCWTVIAFSFGHLPCNLDFNVELWWDPLFNSQAKVSKEKKCPNFKSIVARISPAMEMS